jgi:hypothetical protein
MFPVGEQRHSESNAGLLAGCSADVLVRARTQSPRKTFFEPDFEQTNKPVPFAVSSRKDGRPHPLPGHRQKSHPSDFRAFFLARTGRRQLAPPQVAEDSWPHRRWPRTVGPTTTAAVILTRSGRICSCFSGAHSIRRIPVISSHGRRLQIITLPARTIKT